MRSTCPGCKRKFWRAGGTIKIPSDSRDGKPHEILICEDCAKVMEEMFPVGQDKSL